MIRKRVIPCLLLKDRGLVKTLKFKDPKYVGDPVNAIRIFNEKQVDELILLDISATGGRRDPDFELIAEIASECFMPICYGGGIAKFEHAQKLFALGVEKISINSASAESLDLITAIAEIYGSQSVVASIDCKKGLFGGYSVFTNNGSRDIKKNPVEWAKALEQAGAGEIFLNSIDRDGTQKGYDLSLIANVVDSVHVPVIACGGAGSIADLNSVFDHCQVSAVSAGSLFVFHGKHRAVLISYPNINEGDE